MLILPTPIKLRQYNLNCTGFFAAIIDSIEQLFDNLRASVR
jgi:hypothetical protein